MRKFLAFLGVVFVILVVMSFAGCFAVLNGVMSEFHIQEAKLDQPSILYLELDGIIMDGKEFLADLKKYSSNENIKGVLVKVNSPGGVVGPSQEIYAELKRVREEFKKPVVVSCLGLAASGAYYVAVAADKIITNPGSLLGSIGVIMEFANLEKLYEWAKIRRYTIKTGPYKDSGAEYREMREDERLLFQEMANEVLAQFKKAVGDSRKLPADIINKYSDGRVFTGAAAVALGFADQVGTLEDATRIVGQLSGLGVKPEVFTPPAKRANFLNDLLIETKGRLSLGSAVQDAVGMKLLGQPLYLMPGVRD